MDGLLKLLNIYLKILNKMNNYCLNLNKLSNKEKDKLKNILKSNMMDIGYDYKINNGYCSEKYKKENNLIEIDFNKWLSVTKTLRS